MTALLDAAPLVLVALLVLASPVLAILALVQASRLRRRVADLEAQVARLTIGAAEPAAEAPAAASATPQRPPPAPEPSVADAPSAGPAGAARPARASLETRLAERWLVWLGAGALGLGGLFAAGYAVEAGLLGPTVRLALVALLGLALIALAARLRTRTRAEGRPDHVPAALAAGGLVALYGAAAAAYALYGLIEPPVAFFLLALVAMLGVSLGLLFGGLVGLLGAVGAYLVPAIVGSGHPSAWTLFPYLAVVAASLETLAGRARWPWLGWLNLAGAFFWALLWLVTRAGPADALPMAAFALVTGLAGQATPVLSQRDSQGGERSSRALVGAALILLVLSLAGIGYMAAPMAALALLSLACLGAGLLRPEERWLAAMAAAADLLAAAAWQIPARALAAGAPGPLDRALDPLLWLAPSASPLAQALWLVGALWAMAGTLAAWRAPRPGFWAGLAVAVPLAALAVGYRRLAGFALSPPLAWTALVLAAGNLALAERAARRPALRPAQAAYAVGVAGALALGAASVLEKGWLTLALAALLPAMGWVALRLELPEMRRPARWLATIILIRAGLGLDPDLLDTGRGMLAAMVSCGGPMLLMALAARLFRRQREDGLTALLDGGALLFWLLLVLRLSTRAAGRAERAHAGTARIEHAGAGLARHGAGAAVAASARAGTPDPAARLAAPAGSGRRADTAREPRPCSIRWSRASPSARCRS